jgi:hypothetical protein
MAAGGQILPARPFDLRAAAMDDETRLRDLTGTLVAWRAPASRPVDISDPQWHEKLLRDGPPHLYAQYGPIFPVIQELCTLYARATPRQRAAVRDAIAAHRDALNALNQFTPSLAVGGRCTYEEWKAGYDAYKAQDFDGWLRMLIAALALKLTRLDYRDDIMAINHLAQEARLRDIDFAPYRRELQRLSDPRSAERVGLR